MIESAIRGGLSYVAQCYALANFPVMSDYRFDLPTSHLLYLDCNCLYTTCQTYPLPVGGFRFLTDAELLTFDVADVSANSPTGYFLRYPTELHALHNTYPLAPEHVYILKEMLSDTVRLMQDVTGVTSLPSLTFMHETGLEFARQDALRHTLSLSAVLSCPQTRTGQDSPCRCVHSAHICLLYTSPSPRDRTRSRMPSSA